MTSELVRPVALPRTAAPLLSVDRLSVHFGSRERPLPAVDQASFDVAPGETVALVGESGSGKTVTALSILRLEQEKQGRIMHGEIRFDGRGLRQLKAAEIEALRGRRIGMIFQEPMSAFDPLFSIGDQIVETILRHEPITRAAARARALALLERVQIPDAKLRLSQLPEQLSGGMRQRAMIALALACRPDFLIADEPTTALDVTIQAQILALLKELQQKEQLAILLITHDLGVAAELADRVVVMYAGRIAEQAPAEALFTRPAHPYTRGLLDSAVPGDGRRRSQLLAIAGSIPRLDELPDGCRFHPRCPRASAECQTRSPALVAHGSGEVACFHPLSTGPSPAPLAAAVRLVEPTPAAPASASSELPRSLVEARDVEKLYALRQGLFGARGTLRALDSVSLEITRGETFGLVGESGCGKSTLGRVLLQLERP
ncbi:MAG: oligopeptide/dipeptide ABC transporter ATP-binding protein, partial [Polyangiales bacterium]